MALDQTQQPRRLIEQILAPRMCDEPENGAPKTLDLLLGICTQRLVRDLVPDVRNRVCCEEC
jgi:hypothetical protein